MRPLSCDVIIPIYNAYEDLLRCTASVMRHTAGAASKIVLIDDASTDERIRPHLAELAARYPGLVEVIAHTTNQGFVRTVNEGIRRSERDVVLLNSDTEVTAGWLEKMVACSLSSPRIATVTPLSNSAAFFSVPRWRCEGPLPAGFSTDSFGALVESCSHREYPRVPTGLGFCLLIRREAVDAIGVFDEAFSPGYEEETEFCSRAHKRGFLHVLDDATFVFHKGRASFKDVSALRARNFELHLAKHPDYALRIQRFLDERPLRRILRNIQMQVSIARGPATLHVVEELDEQEGLMESLRRQARMGRRVCVLFKSSSSAELVAFLEEGEVPFRFPFRGHGQFEKVLRSILTTFRVSEVRSWVR